MPFRDSKITRILKPFLSKIVFNLVSDSKVDAIGIVNPED